MSEDYVGRTEFNNLKKEVDEIKDSMKDNNKVLQKIDKQVEIILTKLESANNVEDLKLEPLKNDLVNLEKKIEKIESNQTWLWRSLIRSSYRSNLWNNILRRD